MARDSRDLVFAAAGLGEAPAAAFRKPCAEQWRRFAMSHCSRNQLRERGVGRVAASVAGNAHSQARTPAG